MDGHPSTPIASVVLDALVQCGRTTQHGAMPIPDGAVVNSDGSWCLLVDGDLHCGWWRDSLTGAGTRGTLIDEIRSRPGESLVVLCFDIRGFGALNDALGHAAGDEVLRAAYRRLVEVAGDGQVYRIDADEFALLRPGDVDADALALRLATAAAGDVDIPNRETEALAFQTRSVTSAEFLSVGR